MGLCVIVKFEVFGYNVWCGVCSVEIFFDWENFDIWVVVLLGVCVVYVMYFLDFVFLGVVEKLEVLCVVVKE